MMYVPSPPRLRLRAAGVLLLSVGIIFGSFVPRRARGGGGPIPPPLRPPASAPPAAGPAASRTEVAGLAPEVDTAGVAPDLKLGPAPGFGGRYAVLRGAESAGPVPEPAAPAEFPPAPGTPVDSGAAAVPAEPAAAVGPAAPSARFRPEPVRPAPADAIPRGVAAEYPLLALFEGGGRVVFHDLGERPGVVPASVEGTWAEVGNCGRTVRADLSLATARTGELRAIGRGAAADAGLAALVVARQGCALASSRITEPRLPDGDDRRQLAGMEPAGFTAGDLVRVARSGPVRVALFRSAAGQAAVAFEVTRVRTERLWSYVLPGTDGDLSAIGVSRRGSSTRVWLLARAANRAPALVAAGGPDGGQWPPEVRVDLAPR